MEEHDNAGLPLHLGDSPHPQFFVLDEASQAGTGVQSTNHHQHGQNSAMSVHILCKLGVREGGKEGGGGGGREGGRQKGREHIDSTLSF